MSATVLKLRPVFQQHGERLYFPPTMKFPFESAEALINELRHSFELAHEAQTLIGACSFPGDYHGLNLLKPEDAFGETDLILLTKVHDQAISHEVHYCNPLAVLAWAVMSPNAVPWGETHIGMAPIDGRYLVFTWNEKRHKPRLAAHPFSPTRRVRPDSRWIFRAE